MRYQRLTLLLAIGFIMVTFGIFSMVPFAQAGRSVGCSLWHGLGTINKIPTEGTGITGQPLNAGEVLRAAYTLGTATSATATLESPNGTVISQQVLTGGSISFAFVVPSDGTYTVFARNAEPSNGTLNITYRCQAPQSGNNSGGDAPRGFSDGRINHQDGAAPIVVYPYQDDTGAGFDIYTAQGTLALRVTGAQLGALPIVDPNHNIVVSGGPGNYQITAPQYNGKTYVLQFGEPFVNTGYTSREDG
ncbi:MAG: hypothetical protein ACFE0Q_01610 [Anaerolineae bacterium]